MIKFEIRHNLDQVTKSLEEKLQRQARYAAMRAINTMAFKLVDAIKTAMQATFQGGATAYSLRAFRVEKATKQTMTAIVSLRTDAPGKGTPWDKALGHLFTGGTRAWKRMEGAFRSIGVLPPTYMMVPGAGCPLDTFGNPPRGLIIQLIGYFKAFGEQGYRANMTNKRRASLAKLGKTAGGYKTVNGVEYFISRGPGLWYGRVQHLPAGIWVRKGIHGRDIQPVFLFVKAGHWRQVIDLKRMAEDLVGREFGREFQAALADAMRTAR